MNDQHDQHCRVVRRQLLVSVVEMQGFLDGLNTLAARNFAYHAEELMKWMDAALRGDDTPSDDPDAE